MKQEKQLLSKILKEAIELWRWVADFQWSGMGVFIIVYSIMGMSESFMKGAIKKKAPSSNKLTDYSR